MVALELASCAHGVVQGRGPHTVSGCWVGIALHQHAHYLRQAQHGSPVQGSAELHVKGGQVTVHASTANEGLHHWHIACRYCQVQRWGGERVRGHRKQAEDHSQPVLPSLSLRLTEVGASSWGRGRK